MPLRHSYRTGFIPLILIHSDSRLLKHLKNAGDVAYPPPLARFPNLAFFLISHLSYFKLEIFLY